MKIGFNNKNFVCASYLVASAFFGLLNSAHAQTPKAVSNGTQSQAAKPAPALDQTIPEWAHGPSIRYSKSTPVNFPVPDYTSRVTQRAFFNSTKGQPTATLTITTEDEPQTVSNFYLNACRSAGWQTSVPSQEAMSKMGPAGNLYLINGTKDKQSISIVCTRNKSTMKGTNLNITWALNR